MPSVIAHASSSAYCRSESLLERLRRGRATSAPVSPVVLAGLVRFADFAVAAASGILLAALYHGNTEIMLDPLYLAVIAITALSTVVAFDILGLYAPRGLASAWPGLPRLLAGWSLAFVVAGTLVFFFKASAELSRAWLAMWLLLGAGALAAERASVALAIRRLADSGRLLRRAVVYGAGRLTDDLIHNLEADHGAGIRVLGVFDDRSDVREPGSAVSYARLGTLDDLLDVSRAMGVDLVIVALPVSGERRLSEVAGRLSELPADIRLPAQATPIRLAPRLYSHVGPVAMIDLYDRPIADWGVVAKWLFDRGLGLLLVALLSPVMLLVALAIKLDSRGPILFRQKRYGFNNELIEVFKFRSMYTELCDAAASKLVTRDDPRVTRVGRFIRKTSLDELPQLFNVIRGELSLVGPRPHAVAAKAEDRLYPEIVARYFARHKVKPGITGWAQISGWRGETDTQEKIEKRVEHDLAYIENWSVLFDFYILAMTPYALMKAENAY
jgi:Undecaprenyl-phosphate glucose phosphotransferase